MLILVSYVFGAIELIETIQNVLLDLPLDGVGQQSSMINKHIPIPRGYPVLLSFTSVREKALPCNISLMKAYFGGFRMREMKK